jgi:hypothetical protein
VPYDFAGKSERRFQVSAQICLQNCMYVYVRLRCSRSDDLEDLTEDVGAGGQM